MNLTQISEDYYVSPQILPEDVPQLEAAGFIAIICNRPDGEDPAQPTAAEIAAACERAAIAFHHIPVSGTPIPSTDIEEHQRIVTESDGLVLGYCRSGQRSAVIFEANA